MQALLADIVSGAMVPGGRALREADIAARFGVSRGVARECVRGLEERGLVSVKPGRGATVNPPNRWAVFDTDVVSALLDADRGLAMLGEYLECRRILEVEAIALAAERADADDLAALSDCLSRLTAAAQHASANPSAQALHHEADVAFHKALVAATHNTALAAMLAPLWRALSALRPPAPPPGRPPEQAIAAHRRILDAVAAGDAEGARIAMRDHLVSIERDVHEHTDGHVNSHAVDQHRAA
jgi:DNA-binding FadR family transcriptional regulator